MLKHSSNSPYYLILDNQNQLPARNCLLEPVTDNDDSCVIQNLNVCTDKRETKESAVTSRSLFTSHMPYFVIIGGRVKLIPKRERRSMFDGSISAIRESVLNGLSTKIATKAESSFEPPLYAPLICHSLAYSKLTSTAQRHSKARCGINAFLCSLICSSVSLLSTLRKGQSVYVEPTWRETNAYPVLREHTVLSGLACHSRGASPVQKGRTTHMNALVQRTNVDPVQPTPILIHLEQCLANRARRAWHLFLAPSSASSVVPGQNPPHTNIL